METKLARPPRTHSLSATLAIAFAELSILVLVAFALVQLILTVRTQQVLTKQEQDILAQGASAQVSNYINSHLSVLNAATKLGQLPSGTPEQTKQLLESLLGVQPDLRQVVFFNQDNQQVAHVSRLPQSETAEFTNHFTPEVLAQVKGSEKFFSPVYIDAETSEPLMVIAVPAVNVFGEYQGLVAAELNLKFMWQLVDQLKVGASGAAYIVDRQGKLLAYRDTSRVLSGEQVSRFAEVHEFLVGEEVGSWLDIVTGIDGKPVVGAFQALGSPDWAVIVELPWQEAYAPALQSIISSIITTIILAVLAALIGFLLARRLAGPVVELKDTAVRITEGQLNLQAPVVGTTEVAGLATAFNEMTTRLRQTLQNLEQRVADRTRELEASNLELQANRNQLQTNNAELEASRNQLQANNRELEASRTTLQLNNAELEASRNQLQASYVALEANQAQLESANVALQRNTAYLQALNDTAVGLIGRLDVNELLTQIVARAAGLVGTVHGYIYLLEPDASEMRLRYGVGLYEPLIGARTRPGRGLAGTVWESGKSLVLADYQQWDKRLIDPQREAIRSVIGVPLKRGGETVGVIGLASTDQAREFGETQLDAVSRFAQLATIALDNARLFEETEHRLTELSTLNRLSQVVASERNMVSLLNRVGEELVRAFDVQNASVALLNKETNQPEYPYVLNNGVREAASFISPDEGLVSAVLNSRQPLVLNENAETIRTQLGAKNVGAPVKSYVGVPIIVGDEVMGVLSLSSLEHEHAFGENDIRLLSTIASTTGVAIQNIRLFEQTQHALRDTERAAMREHSVAQELQILTSRLTGEGWKTYLEREPADIWVEDSISDSNGGHLEANAMQRAQETASLVIANSGERSAVALPIMLRGQVIGTIGLEDLDPDRKWDDDELSIVKEVTDNVALALDNARLYTESQRRVTELDALNSISQAVTTELDLDSLLKTVGDEIQSIFDVQNTYIALYDRETQMISLPYFVNDRQRVSVEPIPFGEGITSHIIRTRQPLVINRNTDQALSELGAKTFGNHAKSYLGVPIFVGEDVTGVISIQSITREDVFDDSNVRLLETIAATIGAAIQNAQLYGAMQQEVVTRQRAEEEIKLSLKEKEVLLKEIHHRVKNNLQIITSLLNLQSAQIKDPEAVMLFRESQSRVRSMALIHEKLYQSKDLARIDFDGYVRDLMVYLFRSYGANPDQIRTHIETHNMFLGIDTAIPCGLIISELVTNTLKYAFPEGRRGNLYVGVGPEDDGHLTLLVKDDGVGFREGFNWRESDSLGLQLVSTLSSQLHGTIDVNGQGGTSFKITFPG